jgi:hypothetical protein
MFDPNYVPETVDLVLAYTQLFYLFERKLGDYYKKASEELGIQIVPRMLDDAEIVWAELNRNVGPRENAKTLEELNLTRDTILLFHAGGNLVPCESAHRLAGVIDSRIIIIYDDCKGSEYIRAMAQVFRMEFTYDLPLHPTKHISFQSRFKDYLPIAGLEGGRCEGRIRDYFIELAALRGER